MRGGEKIVYEMKLRQEEDITNRNKYRFSLDFIIPNDDEIEIINLLFSEYKFNPANDELTINDIIQVNGKDYIIDPNCGFNFKCIWCDDDPYAYYIHPVVFDKEHMSASIEYGWSGGFLDGRRFRAYFAKENNEWKKIKDKLILMS